MLQTLQPSPSDDSHEDGRRSRKAVDFRVALVTNIAPPYRIATWSALAARVGSLRVCLCAETEPNRVWRTEGISEAPFETRLVPGRHLYVPGRDWAIHWNRLLLGELRSFAPSHLIVTGYDSPTYWLAIGYARRHCARLILWWESHEKSGRSRGWPMRAVRRFFCGLADSVVTAGTLASQQVESLGVPRERIVTGVNAIDSSEIEEHVERYRAFQPRSGKPGVRFLYVGQFIARKGVRELIEAFGRLQGELATLTLVGYGPLEQQLRRLVAESRIPGVNFAGATRTPAETARFYAAADVLVVPSSREVWGFVVNEGLAAGLYVVAGTEVGAAEDLIRRAPYLVGRTFDAGSVEALEQAMRRAISELPHVDREAVRSWGRAHTPEAYGEALLRALEVAG